MTLTQVLDEIGVETLTSAATAPRNRVHQAQQQQTKEDVEAEEVLKGIL